MADTDLAALLERIRERNEQLRHRYGYVGGLLALADAKDDVPRLLAAVEAALKAADDWSAEATRLHQIAWNEADPQSRIAVSLRAQAFEDCARGFRAAITAALAAAEVTEALAAAEVTEARDDCPIEAVFGGADEERYPCTYAKGHDGPHSFEGPNPPSAADLSQLDVPRG
jgi:hypothetical protein